MKLDGGSGYRTSLANGSRPTNADIHSSTSHVSGGSGNRNHGGTSLGGRHADDQASTPGFSSDSGRENHAETSSAEVVPEIIRFLPPAVPVGLAAEVAPAQAGLVPGMPR
jgi:hypothetical protein